MFYIYIYIYRERERENLLDKKHKISNFNIWYVVYYLVVLYQIYSNYLFCGRKWRHPVKDFLGTHSSRDLKLSINVNNRETYGYLKHTYVMVSHNPLMQLAKQ